MDKFTDEYSNSYTPSMTDRVPNNTEYVSLQEAAAMIGCSNKRVYQYVRSGRLPAQRIGNILVIPIEAVQEFKPAPSGRLRVKAPAWRRYRSQGKVLATLIQVPLRSDNAQEVQQKLNMIEPEQYTFPGTAARYIFGDARQVRIVLIWREVEMPDEAARQQDLRSFQQAFPELDWEAACSCTTDIFRHT